MNVYYGVQAAADAFCDHVAVVVQNRETIRAPLSQSIDNAENLRFDGRSDKA